MFLKYFEIYLSFKVVPQLSFSYLVYFSSCTTKKEQGACRGTSDSSRVIGQVPHLGVWERISTSKQVIWIYVLSFCILSEDDFFFFTIYKSINLSYLAVRCKYTMIIQWGMKLWNLICSYSFSFFPALRQWKTGSREHFGWQWFLVLFHWVFFLQRLLLGNSACLGVFSSLIGIRTLSEIYNPAVQLHMKKY